MCRALLTPNPEIRVKTSSKLGEPGNLVSTIIVGITGVSMRHIRTSGSYVYLRSPAGPPRMDLKPEASYVSPEPKPSAVPPEASDHELRAPSPKSYLGTPVVPFSACYFGASLFKLNSRKQGTLIIREGATGERS